MRRNTFPARRIALLAVFIALYVVLSLFVSVNIANVIKLSFAALPLILAAMLFGPADGMIVAALGEFLYQMLAYGFDATTLLWPIPKIVFALIVGLYARKKNFELTLWQSALIIAIAGLVMTLLNTVTLHYSALIQGWNANLTAVAVLLRFVNSLIMSAIYTIIAPKTVEQLRRVYRNNTHTGKQA